jgi:hypothetical protein
LYKQKQKEKYNMTTKPLELKRGAYGLVAAVLTVVVAAAGLLPGYASAAQMTTRSIKVSDSSKSGGAITSGVGSGTNVAAVVGFTVSNTATNIGGIVIDFCSNSPIIGDACTAPVGFNVNRSSTALSGQTNISGFAVNTTDTQDNRIILDNGTPAAPGGAAVSFTLGDGSTNGFTNPTANGPLYARIYTYTTGAAADAHDSDAPTGYTDFGGIALSIQDYVNITARVQETITFCASADDISGAGVNPALVDCGDATVPAVVIGHGGPPAILEANAVDNATVYTQMSTNATSGAVVRMRATNTCANGGLSSTGGAVCNIPGINTGTTPAPMVAGTAGFGLFVSASTTTTGVPTSSGTIDPDASYHNPAHVTEGVTPDLYYGMDTSTAGDNVMTTYGDTVMACTGPVSQVNNHLVFGATASLTTQAGIYTGNEVLIATGTF